MRTCAILLDLPFELIKTSLVGHPGASAQLLAEIASNQPIGDEAFHIMGVLCAVEFQLVLYLNDNEKVLLNRHGTHVGYGGRTVHTVRFEPLGLTHAEVCDLPYNPTYTNGHWEPDRNPTGRFVPMPAKWK
jgi:hypothetical protein